MTRDLQDISRSLELLGKVAFMRKSALSAVIFVITYYYDGHTQYPTTRNVLGKTGQGRDNTSGTLGNGRPWREAALNRV